VFALPLPHISVTITGRAKDHEEKRTAKAEAAPLVNNSFDPVMVMMLVAVILLSSAVLVYAARS
jgi:trehalose-6-phosphatase